MAMCEDAPCCGCCGVNLYGVDQSADGAYSPYEDDLDSWYEDYDEGDEDAEEWDDADTDDAREDFGYFGDEALCGE